MGEEGHALTYPWTFTYFKKVANKSCARNAPFNRPRRDGTPYESARPRLHPQMRRTRSR